jgi:thioredoxin-dependent peroxiredoxin
MNGLLDGLFIVMVVIAAGIAAWFYYLKRAPLQPGQLAPDFRLSDQHGRILTLADFRGRWLALYFYPKDDTPGCTRQACGFRDDLDKLKALGAEVVGVSVDTVQSHAGFASKFDLPFPLLADATCETAARYQSLINLGIVKFARRNTFLIDPTGNIVKVYESASARHNSSEVANDLQQLKQMEQANHSGRS